MMKIKVKWQKETFVVDVDTSAPVATFKAQLQFLSGVPADRQKIMGVKGGQLKDDANLAAVGLSETKPVMLIGNAETLPEKPQEPMVFAEDDTSGGHKEEEIMSNGLVNLGNTCYMNSMIQVMRTVPELRSRLGDSSHPVAKALKALLEQLDSTRDPVPPIPMWTSLMASYPEFARTSDRGFPMQHDAQEAFTSVLDTIGESDGSAKEPLFRGMLSDKGSNGKEGRSPFTMLRCMVNSDVTVLETGLALALENKPEPAAASDGTSDTASAPRGESKEIAGLPPYIAVHMCRFAWRQDTKENAKSLRPVGFPQVLDLQPLCTDELKAEMEPARTKAKARRERDMQRKRAQREKADPSKTETAALHAPEEEDAGPDGITGFYELCGVVSHKGRTLDGGHYISWAKKQGSWLVFDDDHVGRASDDDISRLRGVGEAHIAYVLLYRARDPVTGLCSMP